MFQKILCAWTLRRAQRERREREEGREERREGGEKRRREGRRRGREERRGGGRGGKGRQREEGRSIGWWMWKHGAHRNQHTDACKSTGIWRSRNETTIE